MLCDCWAVSELSSFSSYGRMPTSDFCCFGFRSLRMFFSIKLTHHAAAEARYSDRLSLYSRLYKTKKNKAGWLLRNNFFFCLVWFAHSHNCWHFVGAGPKPAVLWATYLVLAEAIRSESEEHNVVADPDASLKTVSPLNIQSLFPGINKCSNQ